MNGASHYIDGSQIYGSNDYIVSTLRSFIGGTLISVTDNNQEFCPHSNVESSDVNKYFFNTGNTDNTLIYVYSVPTLYSLNSINSFNMKLF